GHEPVAVELSDGSKLDLAAESELVTLENRAHDVVLLFERGRASFSVNPQGHRRWSIECGLATVEVVGTRFTIDRSPSRLFVGVAEGVVLVRGEAVPERVRRLTRGETLEVSSPEGVSSREDVVPSRTLGTRISDTLRVAGTERPIGRSR